MNLVFSLIIHLHISSHKRIYKGSQNIATEKEVDVQDQACCP